MSKDITRECCECGLIHKESECVKVRDDEYKDIPVFNNACPYCGCNEYYNVESNNET